MYQIFKSVQFLLWIVMNTSYKLQVTTLHRDDFDRLTLVLRAVLAAGTAKAVV